MGLFESLVSSTLAKFIMYLLVPLTVLVKVGLAPGTILFTSSIILGGSGFVLSKTNSSGACSSKVLAVNEVSSVV